MPVRLHDRNHLHLWPDTKSENNKKKQPDLEVFADIKNFPSLLRTSAIAKGPPQKYPPSVGARRQLKNTSLCVFTPQNERRNVGICHSCRSRWHLFEEWTRKRHCPWCPHGFQKCFEVEKETPNKGRLFNTCSNKCGFFDWLKEGESSEESSNIKEVKNVAANGEVEDLPSMLDTLAQITEKRDVGVSLNVTFRKGKGSLEGNEKGTGPA